MKQIYRTGERKPRRTFTSLRQAITRDYTPKQVNKANKRPTHVDFPTLGHNHSVWMLMHRLQTSQLLDLLLLSQYRDPGVVPLLATAIAGLASASSPLQTYPVLLSSVL